MNGAILLIWIQISAQRNEKAAKGLRLQQLKCRMIIQVIHKLYLLFTVVRVLG